MTLKKHITCILSFIILATLPLIGQNHEDVSYGLRFRSHDVEKEFRTGLDLTSGKALRIGSGDSLCFDIKFRSLNESFGYVFRMVELGRKPVGGERISNIDLISDLLSDNMFSVVINRKTILQISREDIGEISEDKWHHIVFAFGDGDISLSVDGITRKAVTSGRYKGRYLVYFGKNDDPRYFTRDVPPMTLAGIRFVKKGRTAGRWDLNRHRGNIAPESEKGLDATAENPEWEADKFALWEEIARFSCQARPQISFDGNGQWLFVAKGDSIHIVNTATGTTRHIAVSSGVPINTMSNNMIYLPETGKLLSYCLEDRRCAVFDMSSMKWDNKDTTEAPLPQFWHHDRCVLPDGRVAVFGGYGYHQYRSMLQIFGEGFSPEDFIIKDISSDISPRYLSGMVPDKDGRLYVFGGYGSLSGSQRESPYFRTDLYIIEPDSGEVRKIRDFGLSDKLYTCSNSMVFSPDSTFLLVLGYNNLESSSEITIKKIPLYEGGRICDLGNSIPYRFNDTESWCDLAFDREGERLVAVTSHMPKGQKEISEIALYSINFPPVISEEQSMTDEDRHGSGMIWWILACLAVAVSATAAVTIRRRAGSTASGQASDTMPQDAGGQEPQPLVNVPETEESVQAPPASCVSLLGGFQVFGQEHDDITGSFTKTLKSLFLLILLETVKTGKGISSASLTELLWFDKYEESARNNRNVNIRKLRLLLSKTGGISISNENSYWRLDTEPGKFSCDYMEARQLMDKFSAHTLQPDELETLLKLLSKGQLLPFTQADWLDSYKADFSSKTIDVMTALGKDIQDSGNPGLAIRVADIILLHDNIDEYAVCMKCRALTRLSRNGLARKTYDSFCAEYEKLMGQLPELTFEDAAGIK